MMKGVMNAVRREVNRLFSQLMPPRIGIVSSYDPEKYACRVLLQPENVETGWIPIMTQWVGNGWGTVCGPSEGDVVGLEFQEWDRNAGYVVGRFYSTVTAPPGPCPSGEMWVVHKSGSFFKFKNDGTVEIVGNTAINMTAPQVNITGDVHIDGEVTTTEDITADGDLYDHSAGFSSVNEIRTIYNEHTHNETGTVTLIPNQLLP